MEEKIKNKLQENIERILDKKILSPEDVKILKEELYELNGGKQNE